MKNLFTLIVLALAFSACQTKQDPTMEDLLQGTWEAINNTSLTAIFTGDKYDDTLNTVVASSFYFETHLQDKDGRSWAVYTNATTLQIGFYASNNKMSVNDKVNIPNITGPLTCSFTKK